VPSFLHNLAVHGPDFFAILLGAAMNTVIVTAGGLLAALVLGLVVALPLLSKRRWIRGIARTYVEIFRGTPVLTQLFILYFGLPELGIELTPVSAAVLGFGLNGAAYLAEVYRAGILAINKGQMEAALSVGMRPTEGMRYIVLPQAVRIVVPPLTNYAVSLLKDSAIVSAIAVPEIMFRARQLVTETYLSLEIYVVAAALYLLMSLPLIRLARRFEGARQAWQ
jgi:polar amino acid transport system permease protein/cystine transport system permease protein